MSGEHFASANGFSSNKNRTTDVLVCGLPMGSEVPSTYQRMSLFASHAGLRPPKNVGVPVS